MKITIDDDIVRNSFKDKAKKDQTLIFGYFYVYVETTHDEGRRGAVAITKRSKDLHNSLIQV